MPAYPIPNWLHGPPDPAQILLHSQQIGAEIAAQRARLQQQAQLEQIKLELEQEHEDRQSRQKQQELEIQKSYDEQQVGLRQKALEEAQQRIDQQVKAASQKYAAQQRIQQRIAAGEDPDKVYLEEGAMAGGSMSGLSGFARDLRMAHAPKDIQAGQVIDSSGSPIPGMAAIGGRARLIPRIPAPRLSPESSAMGKNITQSISALDKALNEEQLKENPDQNKIGAIQGQLVQAEELRHKILKPSGQSVPGKEDMGGPIPLPKTEKELLEGQVYQTSKGLGMWDASQKKFKLVPQDQAPTAPQETPEDTDNPPDEE